MPTPSRSRSTRRRVCSAALAAVLAAGMAAAPAAPALAETGQAASSEAALTAAYGRAVLLGRVFASGELASAAADAVTADLDPAGGAEVDIAGPPPALGEPPAAPPTTETDVDAASSTVAAEPPRMLQPATDGAVATDSSQVAGFEMVGEDADEAEGYAPRAGALGGGGTRPAGSGGGGWVCPTPAWTWFTHDWGFPRSGGRTHKGNDIFAPAGSPLVAVDDGVVTKVARVDRGLGGLTVSYLTGDALVVYNAHLDAIAAGIAPGVRVVTGQQIGTVGNSGNARTTPPHLHIGIYPAAGGVIDPYPYTSLACR